MADTSQLMDITQPVKPPAPPQSYNTPIQVPDFGSNLQFLPVPNIVSPQTMVDKLTDITKTTDTYLNALGKSIEQNTELKKQYEERQKARNAASVEAYHNLVDISKWPHKLADLIGIFNPKYSAATQQAQIAAGAAESKQDADSTTTQMEINSQTPALLETQSKLQKENYELLTKGFTLQKDITSLNQGTADLILKRADLGIKLGDERDKEIKRDIAGMTLPQLQAEFKRAQAGQGRFAGIGGYLEAAIDEHLKSDLAVKNLQQQLKKGGLDILKAQYDVQKAPFELKSAQLGVLQGQQNLQKGGLDLALNTQALESGFIEQQRKILGLSKEQQENINDGYRQVMKTVDPVTGQAAIDDAISNGRPFATVLTPTGQAVTVPINIAIEENKKVTDAYNGLATGAAAHNAQMIGQSIMDVTSTSAALARFDRRALTNFAIGSQISQKFDPSKPGTFAATNAQLELLKKSNDEIVASAAKSAGTPEAKAGIEYWAKNGGKFDASGAPAVFLDIASKPGGGLDGKYKSAFTKFKTEVANRAKRAFNIGVNLADPTAVLSMMGGSRQTKLQGIIDEVASDVAFMGNISNDVQNQYHLDLVNQSLSELAQGTAPSGIFAQAITLKQTHQFDDDATDSAGNKTKAFSYLKMQLWLDEQTTLTGRKQDFNQILIDNLNMKTTQAADTGVADPAYTLGDQSAEATFFTTTNPRGVMGLNLLNKLNAAANAIRSGKIQQLRSDISGQTQAQAVHDFASISAQMGGTLDPNTIPQIQKTVPSAAFPNQTADTMRRIYMGQ